MSMTPINLREELIVGRLENFCMYLKASICCSKRILPLLDLFVRNISLIESKNNFQYILSLLHECCLLNNSGAIDILSTGDKTPDECLDLALSSFSSSSEGFPALNRNFHEFRVLYEQSNKDANSQSFFNDYLKLLHRIVNNRSGEFKIHVNSDFTCVPELNTPLNRTQISKIADILVSEKCIQESDKQNFKNCFGNTVCVAEKKIKWIMVGKNKSPNYYCLFLLFKEISNASDLEIKKFISDSFVDASGNEIKPEKLKKREESKESERFIGLVKRVTGSLENIPTPDTGGSARDPE